MQLTVLSAIHNLLGLQIDKKLMTAILAFYILYSFGAIPKKILHPPRPVDKVIDFMPSRKWFL